MNLGHYLIDKSWTLFLDRDGVINHRIIDDYVKSPAEFEFLPNALNAIKICKEFFGKIIIVTNQQGIGKGLMTTQQLEKVHEKMLNGIAEVGGRIDQIYFCPELADSNHPDRKPEIGMAIKAQKDFPEIDFSKSVMVGDSISDMEFGRKAGMVNVLIASNDTHIDKTLINHSYESLFHFSKTITK
jgi:histidinol-phosphate phosphatase family protein